MKRQKYGIPMDVWDAAKEEARREMSRMARRENQISYGDLAKHICRTKRLCFEPQDSRFHEMLGEISEAENAAGRGMLSVLVVRQDGDKRPGPGFFKLARKLCRDTSDKEAFWVKELRKVYCAWSSTGLP